MNLRVVMPLPSHRQFAFDWWVTTYPPLKVAPGDELTFIFETGTHDVYTVQTQEEFDTCNLLNAQVVSDTGPVTVAIDSTMSGKIMYFLCTYDGHCQGGQKLEVVIS